ncbi:protein FMP32, mitochondrial-like [Salvia miltiorrhiza]|uniref:protein FMP32, mitochondrial-like n=1 Tax=Salvia miltiorrhiza TaxID=226208 RepID=UPI0025AC4A92|nr:protein FMP32, mitochondrial-like [Salvia miltiorrhiza]
MAAAYCRRALLMAPRLHGANRVGFGFRVSASRTFSDHVSRPSCDLVRPDCRRLILVDTLALVRRLEANGLPTKQAEAITEALKEVQNDSYDNVSHNFASKVDMEKSVMMLESNSSKFETEVKSSVIHHVSLLQQENEKLKSDIEKIRSELRYEVDKVTAGLRLDLNLEKGRIRDELNHHHQETINLNSKIDRETHGLRALIEALKYELIKYCVGTFASIAAVGLALLRVFL